MAEQIGQMLIKAAREMGAEDLRLERGGKHPRVIGRIGDREFMYVVPGSSSDWRAGRNALSGLRRVLAYQRPRQEKKDGTTKHRGKRNKSRTRSSSGSAVLHSLSKKPPTTEREDRYFGPLAALAEHMQTAEFENTTDNAAESSLEPSKPAKRLLLRTPWLGRRPRFQEL